VPSSFGFLLRAFLLAGLLFGLWSPAGLGDLYARGVIAVAAPPIWLLSGFAITRVEPQPAGLDVYIGRGGDEGKVPLQPRELFSGLVPFLALLGATRPLSARRRLRALAVGGVILFAFHVGLMVLGTYFTGGPQMDWPREWVRAINRGIDVIYAFYGLVGFAALPFLLWYWLARPRD
jgi:hypothetical protein